MKVKAFLMIPLWDVKYNPQCPKYLSALVICFSLSPALLSDLYL